MARRLAISLLLCLTVAGVLAAPSVASHTQAMTFEAPRDLLDPALRAPALEEIASLGAKRLRIVLYWKDVAPAPTSGTKPNFDATDPAAYNWTRYDPAIDAARERGWPVLLTISGPVPYWATLGRRDDRTRPSPTEFERFTQAVARHYGERVSQFAIWNEPNHPKFLLPQFFKGEIASPQWYRRLFISGVRGLKAGGLANPSVLLGETAPRGNASTVAPLAFLRGTLCLSASYKRDRSCSALDVDGYAHHAYTTQAGPFFVPSRKDDVTIGVLGRLVSALDKAAAAGALPRRLPIYLTEFGIQSTPDPIFGVSQQRQAEYQAISEMLAWNQPRVRAFSQYLLRDDLPIDGVSKTERYGGFESGLRFADGRAKLSLRSFPVPLVALRKGSKVSLWGLARPAGTQTKVTVQAGARTLKTYRSYTTDSHGYFRATVPYVAGRRYRLRWVSPEGKVYLGTPIRVITKK